MNYWTKEIMQSTGPLCSWMQSNYLKIISSLTPLVLFWSFPLCLFESMPKKQEITLEQQWLSIHSVYICKSYFLIHLFVCFTLLQWILFPSYRTFTFLDNSTSAIPWCIYQVCRMLAEPAFIILLSLETMEKLAFIIKGNHN